MFDALDKLATWTTLKPLVIALMTIAVRIAISTDLATKWHYKVLIRRVFVAVCVAYLVADLAPSVFEDPAYQSLALVAAAFFADDIVSVAVELGRDFRKGGSGFIKRSLTNFWKRRK